MPRTAISSETLRSAIEYGLYTFYSGRSRAHHRTTFSRFPGVHVTCCEQASTYGCCYCCCWHHFVEFVIVETIAAAASLYELCVSHLYTASVPRPTNSAPPPQSAVGARRRQNFRRTGDPQFRNSVNYFFVEVLPCRRPRVSVCTTCAELKGAQ